MRLLFYASLIIFSSSLNAQHLFSYQLEQANADANNCKAFYEFMKTRKNESSVAKGYFALSVMMQAKLYKNPFTKLSFFNKGKSILEETILANPNVAELRFLRFSVQNEIPAILLYFNDIDSDKKMLDNYYLDKNEDQLTELISKYYRLKDFDFPI